MKLVQSFNALVELVKFDTDLRLCRESIAKLLQEEQKLKARKDQLEDALKMLKAEVHNAKKQVDTVELEMKELNDQEKVKKNYLDHLNEYKEYKSLKSEIDQLHELQKTQEDLVVSVWNTLEQAQERYDQQVASAQQEVMQIDGALEHCLQKKKLLNDKLDDLVKKRPEKEQHVPADWIAKYSLMQARVDDPVVPVESSSCTACFYQLLPTDLILVKKGSLAQCKNCFRLLYLKEVMG